MIVFVVWVVLRHPRHSNTRSTEDPFLSFVSFTAQIMITKKNINININDKVLVIRSG